jgi:hypothetical protein
MIVDEDAQRLRRGSARRRSCRSGELGTDDAVLERMTVERAIELMDTFAVRTGLVGERTAQRRYLWTDAFAVCNFIGLAHTTGEPRFLELAKTLVDRVHHILGRHRSDDERRGWISGLSEQEGEAHPTLGGLRIGKPLPERLRGQRIDERLEWDRDGQYFHYLTKWIHALRRLSHASGDSRFATWARELADAARRTFVHGGARKRMHWKMSIDLARPLVSSMGQHDPLDGYVTCCELAADDTPGPDLRDAIDDFASMIDRHALATADPLGLGGLLVDAYRLAKLDRSLQLALLEAALVGLRVYATQPKPPIEERLAFRELGLAIGLVAVERLEASLASAFGASLPLRDELASVWWSRRTTRGWAEHEDINDVMLATCLAPTGFLG